MAMTADEKKWRGRDAVHTLAEAERIKNDPVLSKLAAKEAKSMAKEHQSTAAAMSKVAARVGTTKRTSTPAKSSSSKSSRKR